MIHRNDVNFINLIKARKDQIRIGRTMFIVSNFGNSTIRRMKNDASRGLPSPDALLQARGSFFTSPQLEPPSKDIPSSTLENAVTTGDFEILPDSSEIAMNLHFNRVALQPGSKCELRVKFPFSTSTPGLFIRIHQAVEAVYSEMDKLEGSGLGIGLDCLPKEIPLAESKDRELFSGTIFFYMGAAKVRVPGNAMD
jgi:hypothetical protein